MQIDTPHTPPAKSSRTGRLRNLRFPAMALTAFLLGGCSFLKLGYRHLDWVLYYTLQKQFDLSRDQKSDLRSRVDEYVAWHKQEMLADYVVFLKEAAQRMPDGVDSLELEWGFERYRDLRRRTLEPMVEASTAFLLSLDGDQLRAYTKKASRKNSDKLREWRENPEKSRDKRAERTLDQVEEFTGKLSASQRRAIDSLSRALPLNTGHWLEFRQNQQNALAEAAHTGDSTRLAGFLRDYFLTPEKLRTPSHQEAVARQELHSKGMILAVSALLTPEQRSRAAARLSEFTRDLEQLGPKR